MKALAILDAPSNLGLRPPRPGHIPGVYKLPDALRRQDLVARLDAYDAGRIAAPPYSMQRDDASGFRNGQGIRSFSVALADQVVRLVQQGFLPIVLGGDCSILLGNLLALKRLGTYGLMFIDGHADFCYPRAPRPDVGFSAAGLDLALATGHGPDELTNIEGAKPYVREEHVAVLGYWDDPRDAADYATEELARSKMHLFDIDQIRRVGPQQTALAALAQVGSDGCWIHLDADVLDREWMPAVDSPNDHGLTYPELIELVGTLMRSQRIAGIEITIFDPELDPTGQIATTFADALVTMLATSA